MDLRQTVTMLDRRTAILLEATNFLCERGYTVLEKKELQDYFPESLRPDEDSLRLMIEHLASQAYLDVRYADDVQVCLCPLPKGRIYFEEREEKRKSELELLKRLLLASLVASFVGGLFGALLAGAF